MVGNECTRWCSGMGRLVAVGMGEVDKSERYFEGRSQALVRLKEKGGVKDDF